MRGVLALLMLPGGLVVGSGCDAVCEGDFVVETQADLNALAGCVEIRGSLEILGVGDDDNRAPTSLVALERIEGRLRVAQTKLYALTGLEHLVEVGGVIDVYNNEFLTNIDGLSGLQTTEGLFIEGNDRLTHVAGFDRLVDVGDVVIRANRWVNRVGGFRALERVGGEIEIEARERIDGFDRLTSTEGSVTLTAYGHPDLDRDRVVGFSQLHSLGDDPSATLSVTTTAVAGFDRMGPTWPHRLFVRARRVDGLGGIETIAGDVELVVDSYKNLRGDEPIEPLDALGHVRTWHEVGGSLVVRGDGLVDLFPFDQLYRVGDALELGPGGALRDIGAWSSLVEAGTLTIHATGPMGSIHGFRRLERLAGLHIGRGAGPAANALTLIDGFGALRTIDGPLDIQRLPVLSRIVGFGALSDVGGAHPGDPDLGLLRLGDLPQLNDVGGLASLASVGHVLFLYKLPALEALPWLELKVPHLGLVASGVLELPEWPSTTGLSSLVLRDNPHLGRLGLHHLSRVASQIDITGNRTLPCGEVETLVRRLTAPPAALSVDDNLGRCFRTGGSAGLGASWGHARGAGLVDAAGWAGRWERL